MIPQIHPIITSKSIPLRIWNISVNVYGVGLAFALAIKAITLENSSTAPNAKKR